MPLRVPEAERPRGATARHRWCRRRHASGIGVAICRSRHRGGRDHPRARGDPVMGTRTSVRAMVGGLGLMLSSALAGDAVTPRPTGAPPPRSGPDPWTAHLALMDARLS